MKGILRWLANNIPLIVLALMLAVVAWIVAEEEGDPTLEEQFERPIPITLPEMPAGMVIVGEFDKHVEITVRAPTSVWGSIEAEDFHTTLDLSKLETGTNRLPVLVTLDRKPSRITWEPEDVSLEIRPEADRTIPVRVELTGEPTLGYNMQSPLPNPTQVTITGPDTYVDQVVQAVAEINIRDASGNIEGDYDLRPLDSQGQLVPYVTLSENAAHILIPIELSEEYHTLNVRPRRDGLVAYGYTITGISVTPEIVTVSGPTEVIASLPGYIETETINLEDARADVIVRPALQVPANVTLVTSEQVEVRFFIDPIPGNLTLEIAPTIQGLGPGYVAAVAPETFEVFLSGPLPQLEELTTDDVRIILNLFDLEPNTYTIEPQIVVPREIIAESVFPATVQVVIAPQPTGTTIPFVPAITPSPRPGGNS